MALISEHTQVHREIEADKSSMRDSSHHIRFMDDFLEMEKLACLSDESKGCSSMSCGVEDGSLVVDVHTTPLGEQSNMQLRTCLAPYNMNHSIEGFFSDHNRLLISKLQSQVASLLDSEHKDVDIEKVIEGLKCIAQDIQAQLPQKFGTGDNVNLNEDINGTVERVISATVCTSADTKPVVAENLNNAISKIEDFVLSLVSFSHLHKVDNFFSAIDKAKSSDLSIDEFIIILSSTLYEIKQRDSRFSHGKNNETESISSDFVDKITLLENKVPHNHEIDGLIEPSVHGVPQGRNGPDSFQKCSPTDYEQLQEQKNSLATELIKCNETLEETKGQLLETKQQLDNLRSQLAACQNSHSLLKTQLKCMVESYRLLESRSHDLEAEINLLRAKAELLDNELHEEKCAHEEDVIKYKELQEQIERNWRCSACSLSSDMDVEVKTKKEKEIAAAAEKFAECQQTIFLLSKQLKSLRSQADLSDHHPNERHTLSAHFSEDVYQSNLNFSQQLNYNDAGNAISGICKRGEEHSSDKFSLNFSPTEVDGYEVPVSPPNLKPPKHRSSRSSSSFSSSSEEKHGRGFTRFFSKGSNH